jgi:glycosidase
VSVAGEWNRFSTTADPMSDGLFSNTYRAELRLPPGDYGYKFFADGTWALDPSHGLTRYVGDVENSRVEVPDCRDPELRVLRAEATPDGAVTLEFQYLDGTERRGLDPAGAVVTVSPGALPAGAVTTDRVTGRVTVRVTGLARTKYTFRVNARSASGRAAREVLLPMWVEEEPYEWGDGPMYFVFTDRFRNGDSANDGRVGGTDPRADYYGGDYAGVLTALREGYFDRLGVRVLWLSPANRNTHSLGRGSDGRMYTGYHGYWPVAPREVEPHFGTLATLRELTAEAHRRGIRVLLDLVQNQLHRDHPYYRDHARDGWFNGDGSCVCGGPGCGWDEHALDCWFTDYLPDVRWTTMAAVDQMISDALWWLVEADLDGFRVDAVKHMQHIASTTLRARIAELERGNTRYYTVGETFTGADGRDLVRAYISPRELHAQFDFPLFWSILEAFARGRGTLGDLEAAVAASERAYGDAVMSPFLGNHDVERFLSHAAGQLVGDTREQGYRAPPGAPTDPAAYERVALAFTFLLTQRGIPLIYYGDEVGMPGAADPDNRRPMRFGTDLSAQETRLLEHVRAVGRLRATHPGLRRGARRSLHTDGDGYVYTRGAGADVAVVALNRGTTARMVSVRLPRELGVPDGTVLRDALGGPSVTASGGSLGIALRPRGSSIYVR